MINLARTFAIFVWLGLVTFALRWIWSNSQIPNYYAIVLSIFIVLVSTVLAALVGEHTLKFLNGMKKK